MPGPGIHDFELLDRWRDGDREAGDELIERHFDPLYRFLSNKVGAAVDDLLQRVLLAATHSRDRFAGRSSFRTYLFTVARHELYRHYRARQRDADRLDFGVTSVVDLGVSPSGHIAQDEQQRLLLRALRTIPVDHQIALELYYWEDMGTVEIAEVLEIPAGTVRSRLTNARKKVREAIGRLGTTRELREATADDLERWASSMRGKVGARVD